MSEPTEGAQEKEPWYEFTSTHALIGTGRFWITLYYRWAMWDFSYHSMPCCGFYLCIGPLEVTVARAD